MTTLFCAPVTLFASNNNLSPTQALPELKLKSNIQMVESWHQHPIGKEKISIKIVLL